MNILIIYGGKSCEHDISIITACLSKGYFDGNVYSAYMDKQNTCYLVANNVTPSQHLTAKLKDKINFCLGEGKIAIVRGKRVVRTISIDVAVNCCHGVNGEDGTVSALCQLCNIPLVGSAILPSAIAMDKGCCKLLLKQMGIPVMEGKVITKWQFDANDYSLEGVSLPVIIKPCTLGSSIGITLCKSIDEVNCALKMAFAYDNNVLCEKALTDFYEVNCSAMRVDNEVRASDVDCPPTFHDILTFEDKYTAHSKWCKPSQKVDRTVTFQVQQWTKLVYQQLQFSGVIRVDYLVDNATQKVYLNEINCIPGSLAYGLWSNIYTTRQFAETLLKQALVDFSQTNQLQRTFASSVLSGNITKK